MTSFKYKPDGDVLKAFMKNDEFFRLLRGPVGSGKSVCCCVELFRRALQQEKTKMASAVQGGLSSETQTRSLKPPQSRHGSIGFPKKIGASSNGLCLTPTTSNVPTLSWKLSSLRLTVLRTLKKLLSLELTGIWD